VEELYKAHGERVSLIGWSLGGVFARQVAKERPNMVRQLITLGSPFMGVQQANNAAWVYNLFINRDKFEDTNPDLLDLYSKSSLIVCNMWKRTGNHLVLIISWKIYCIIRVCRALGDWRVGF